MVLRRAKLENLQPEDEEAIAALLDQLKQVDRVKGQAGVKPALSRAALSRSSPPYGGTGVSGG